MNAYKLCSKLLMILLYLVLTNLFNCPQADNNPSYGGRVILVKWGNYSRRIGIDGNAEAIRESIKAAFGLRTRRAFWLEDEDNVVRSFDREMPVGAYTLHLDEGIISSLCPYCRTGLSNSKLSWLYDLNSFRFTVS